MTTEGSRPGEESVFKISLIAPETQKPREVLDILQKAERAGITTLEAYNLSGVTLSKDSKYPEGYKKLEDWYWDQIANGNISQDYLQLSRSWILVDTTQPPNYNGGKQLHEHDPFGPLLKRLRKEDKIPHIEDIPETSRFDLFPDELIKVVFPEIAKFVGVEISKVRFLTVKEWNLIGNIKHPEWGEADTREYLEDQFKPIKDEDGESLIGSGLSHVDILWSDDPVDKIAFRPVIVVSPKA